MSWLDTMTVTVPEGEVDGLRVERFEVPEQSIEGLRLAMQGRPCPAGIYTKLVDRRYLWMSDTPAEKSDHAEPYFQMRRLGAERVLINGLGLGMVLQAALSFDHVKHVDVVEIDPRVIKLVGPHYTKDPRVTIIEADAYAQIKAWPKGTRWNVGWSDIWPDLCEDNLPEMAKLRRAYGARCDWHDCWGREQILAHRSRYGW